MDERLSDAGLPAASDWHAVNARLNAFIDLAPDPHGGAGPLAGVTVGVKANIAVAGLPWTAGMALHRARIAERDAEVVRRLRTAGAAIIGTVNMHEAAFGGTTDNPWFGRGFNPHGAGLTPGGSSGGSGSAVAAGLCDAALGTDTMGSIRIPAAYNGVYALKPTHGLLPEAGVEPVYPAFDTTGPFARSLDLLERLWFQLREEPAAPRRAELPLPAGDLIVVEDLGGVECEPAVIAAYDRARALLGEATPLRLPALGGVGLAALIETATHLARHLGPARRSELLSPALRGMLDHAAAVEPDVALIAAVRATLIEAVGGGRVLLMPTVPQAAFAQGSPPLRNAVNFTCLANIAGLPALALPAGADEQGRPVGVQLLGAAGTEGRLFAVGRMLDAALGGYRRPPLFAETGADRISPSRDGVDPAAGSRTAARPKPAASSR